MSTAITDIWFVTETELVELANQLELANINFDSGDGWQWVSGDLLDFRLDIILSHLEETKNTQARIFLFDQNLHFSKGFTDFLTQKLKEIGVSPVYLGSWVFGENEQYQQNIMKVVT